MKQIKIDPEIIERLPNHATINGQYFGLIWEKHNDGMNATTFRLTPEDLERLVNQ